MRFMASGLGLIAISAASMAGAAQTLTYTYDAKGRLVRVVRSGNVSNGVTTTYSHDKANNRTNAKTTGVP